MVGFCFAESRKRCEDSPTKCLCNIFQSDDRDLHSRSQLRLILDKCFTCAIIVMSRTLFKPMAFKHGMPVDLCMAYISHARFDDLDLHARSQ